MEKQFQTRVRGRGWKKLVPPERAEICLLATLLPQKEGFPIRTCVGVDVRLRAHRKWRPVGSEVIGGLAVYMASGNVCHWGWAEEEGDPVPSRGSWVSASGPGRKKAWSPEPSRTPGSEIRLGGSGHVWHPARVFTCAGDCLVQQVHLGISRAQPRGAARRGCSYAWGAAPPALSGRMWSPASAARPGTPSTLTGGLSSLSLEAPAFPEWKYSEGMKLFKISL